MAPLISSELRDSRRYHRHHSLHSPFDVADGSRCLGAADDAPIDAMLKAAIASTLIETGFDTADAVALDTFRNAVDEYVLHLLSYVRQSMSASRRVAPIPQDFEHALTFNDLTPDLLEPYTVPLSPSSRPTVQHVEVPPPEYEPFVSSVKTYSFLGPDLSEDTKNDTQYSYIPKHFPPFPSKHTYNITPVFTTREIDPRRVRERATEEGRLGEEALRKLMRASKDGIPGGHVEQKDRKVWGRRPENMDSMFERTLRAVVRRQNQTQLQQQQQQRQQQQAQNALGDGAMDIDMQDPTTAQQQPKPLKPEKPELGPIVNCDRGFWRKVESRKTHRQHPSAGSMKVEH